MQHKAVGVLAVIRLRMFPCMGLWLLDFPFLVDARNVQGLVQHCCIRVCSDIVEVVTTLMGCPRAQ